MMASELPMQAVPTASPGPSSGSAGECQRRASMATQRFWISVDDGYSMVSLRGGGVGAGAEAIVQRQ